MAKETYAFTQKKLRRRIRHFSVFSEFANKRKNSCLMYSIEGSYEF